MTKQKKILVETSKKQEKSNFSIKSIEILDGFVNLTRLANEQGRDIREFLKLKRTKLYISKLEGDEKSTHLKTLSGIGTFGSREVALKVAQWISVDFEIWCTKQIDTLLQKGKVELKSTPKNSLEASKLLANEVLRLIAIVENKEKENELKTSIIQDQRNREDEILELKARQFKTIQRIKKNEIGREVNNIVYELYFYSSSGDYRTMHKLAQQEYELTTGQYYCGAKIASYESKLDYLNFLKRKKAKLNKENILQYEIN